MPKPHKKPLTWGQVLEGAERLDASHGTERYSRAVITAMLGRLTEGTQPRKTVLFLRRPHAPLTPLQEKMAERRRQAYSR